MYDPYYYCNRHPPSSPPIALLPTYRISNSNDQGNKASMSLHSYRGTEQEGISIILAPSGRQAVVYPSTINSHTEVPRWIDGMNALLAGRVNYSLIQKSFTWMTSIPYYSRKSIPQTTGGRVIILKGVCHFLIFFLPRWSEVEAHVSLAFVLNAFFFFLLFFIYFYFFRALNQQ